MDDVASQLGDTDGSGGGTRSIELPEPLVERVETRFREAGFDSPAGYVAFVLEEVLARVESDESFETGSTAEEPTDESAQEELDARLESLGYLE